MSPTEVLALVRSRGGLVAAAVVMLLVGVLVWPRVVVTSTEPTVTTAQMWAEAGSLSGDLTDEQLAMTGVDRADALVLTVDLEWTHPVSLLGLARQCTAEHADVLVGGSWHLVWTQLGDGQTMVDSVLGEDQFIAVDLEPGAERALTARFVADRNELDIDPYGVKATAQIGWPCQPGPTDWGMPSST